MRRIIALPAELFGALRSFCLNSVQTKSQVVREAAASFESASGTSVELGDSLAADQNDRWSQSYVGMGSRRVAVILDNDFDKRIRRAAARRRRSLNAFYTQAIKDWLAKDGSSKVRQ